MAIAYRLTDSSVGTMVTGYEFCNRSIEFLKNRTQFCKNSTRRTMKVHDLTFSNIAKGFSLGVIGLLLA